MQVFLESETELKLFRLSVNQNLTAKEKVIKINEIINGNINEAKKTFLNYIQLYEAIYHNEDKIFYVEGEKIHEVDKKTFEVKGR